MFLPDVNVWLALAFQSHVHHESAIEWLDAVESPVFFCRLTQQGLLRIATNPKAFGAEAVTLTQAWNLYDAFVADERITFLSEPAELELHWRQLTGGDELRPGVWSDAFLAAFSLSAGIKLVTFDRGFDKFVAVDCVVLN